MTGMIETSLHLGTATDKVNKKVQLALYTTIDEKTTVSCDKRCSYRDSNAQLANRFARKK